MVRYNAHTFREIAINQCEVCDVLFGRKSCTLSNTKTQIRFWNVSSLKSEAPDHFIATLLHFRPKMALLTVEDSTDCQVLTGLVKGADNFSSIFSD